MDAQRLKDDVAIVTGSDSGTRQAIAFAFARESADVAATYLPDKDGAQRTCREIEATGRRCHLARLDVRDPEQVATLFEDVCREPGTPTILMNNAGIDSAGVPVKDMPLDHWDNIIRTNLYGPFYACQQSIRGLDGSDKHGTIINITSVHQEIPCAGAAGYDASKGGLRNLTTTLALELAEKNINVNNIAPGKILTPMNQSALDKPEVLNKQVQSIPMKRAGQPEEIAHVAVFLASDQARYIHGTTIVVEDALMLFQGQGA